MGSDYLIMREVDSVIREFTAEGATIIWGVVEDKTMR